MKNIILAVLIFVCTINGAYAGFNFTPAGDFAYSKEESNGATFGLLYFENRYFVILGFNTGKDNSNLRTDLVFNAELRVDSGEIYYGDMTPIKHPSGTGYMLAVPIVNDIVLDLAKGNRVRVYFPRSDLVYSYTLKGSTNALTVVKATAELGMPKTINKDRQYFL